MLYYSVLILFLYIIHAAAEYRSWALYYVYPLLKGHLPDKYLQHFALFAEALWLLLQTAPTDEDVAVAEECMDKFCLQFESLYGK